MGPDRGLGSVLLTQGPQWGQSHSSCRRRGQWPHMALLGGACMWGLLTGRGRRGSPRIYGAEKSGGFPCKRAGKMWPAPRLGAWGVTVATESLKPAGAGQCSDL